MEGWVAEQRWELEVIADDPEATGFPVLPKRGIIEQTFAWLGKRRPLSTDDEGLPETSEAWIHAVMIHLMLRRLAPS